MRGFEFKLSHDLKEIYEIGVGAGKVLLGYLNIEVKYECDASPLSKCSDDLKIIPEIKGPQTLSVDVELKELNYDVKGKIEVKEGEQKSVIIGVKRGGGHGYAKLKYFIYINVPETETQGQIVLAIYSVNTKTSEKKLIGNPIQLTINVIKPFDVQEINVYPLELFPNDKIRIYIKILSSFKDKLIYNLTYKDTRSKEYAVKKYDILEIKDEVEVIKENNSLKILLIAPQLFYKKEYTFKLNILNPPRIEINEIKLSDKPVIGLPTTLKLILRNKSVTTRVNATITCLIYEHSLTTQVTIPAGETQSVYLETPPLTIKSRKAGGVIRIIESPGDHIIERRLELPPPIELDIKAQVDTKELHMFSSETKGGRITMINNTSNIIRFVITKVKASSTKVNFSQDSIKVYPNSTETLEFYITPKIVGEETIKLRLDAFIDEVKVSETTFSIPIHVKPSFKVINIEYKDLTNNYVLKGQDLSLLLKIEYYAETPVTIHVSSEELSFINKEIILTQGLNEVELIAEVLEMKPLKITLTDGVHSEIIPLDLIVTKPLIDLKLLTSEIYGGVKNTITLLAINLHNKDITWSLKYDKSEGLKILTEESHIKFDPLLPNEKKEIALDVIGLEKGTFDLKLNVKTMFMTESNSQDFNFKLKVKDPVEVHVIYDDTNKVAIPHPLVKELEKQNLTLKCKLRIHNISNDIIEVINVNITPLLIKAEWDKYSIKYLIKDSVEDVSCAIKIPFNYGLDVIKVGYTLTINNLYNIKGSLIELPVSRENYVVVTYDAKSFNKECPYPHMFADGYVKVFIPLIQDDYSLQLIQKYGVPVESSMLLLNLIRNIRKAITNIKRSDSHWNLLVRMIHALIADNSKRSENFKEQIDALEDRIGDIVIIPAILWKYALYRLTGVNLNIKKISELTPGLIYFTSSAGYSLNNEFYTILIKALIEDDSNAHTRLKNIIEKDHSIISPILLTYSLVKGTLLAYNEEVSKKLWESKRYDKYLIYLVLADISWVNNPRELKKLNDLITNEVLNEICYATLALLYRKQILEIPNMILGLGG
jgi:P pilus assembly chaperone PapD